MISGQNRGGLKIPKDSVVFFKYYCYIAFALQQDIQTTCQNKYIDYFTEINTLVDLLPKNIKKACRILSNTFLNNWNKRNNEDNANSKSELLKIAKLSV